MFGSVQHLGLVTFLQFIFRHLPQIMLCCFSAVPQSGFEFYHLPDQLPIIEMINIVKKTTAAKGPKSAATNMTKHVQEI